MKTVPNRTSGRWHFSLPMEFCNNILMSHASATSKSSSVCFSCGWFLGHVRRAWVLSWLQMALVAVHKQSRHLAVDRHTTANQCYPLICLLFVAFEAQIDHCWDHIRVSITDVCLASYFVAPHQPPHRSLMVLVKKLSKIVGNLASYPLNSW